MKCFVLCAIFLLLFVGTVSAEGNDETTSTLLHFNTSTLETNDAAGTQLTFTNTGVVQNSTAPLMFSTSNALFTTDRLRADGNSTLLDFGTGNFTIDFWIRFQQSQAAYASIFGSWTPYQAGLHPGGGLVLDVGAGGTKPRLVFTDDITTRVVTFSTSIPLNQWAHVAIVGVSGDSLTAYVNGISNATYPTHNIRREPEYKIFDIGDEGASTANHPLINVMIDEFRIQKGTAAWTTGFTPPTSEYHYDYPPPVASFNLTLTDTSTNVPTSWQWNATNLLGNNTPVTISTDQNPILTLTQGNWLIDLIATNDQGSDTCNSTIGINLTSPQVYFWERTS